MRGKILFVAGLATGYVLGSRAGRQRYEQIKSGWLSVWHTAPVQNQVDRVQTFAKARLSEVPGLLYGGVRKVATVIAHDADSVSVTATAVAREAEQDEAESAKKAPAKKPAAKKSPAKKPAAKKPATGTGTTGSSTAKK